MENSFKVPVYVDEDERRAYIYFKVDNWFLRERGETMDRLGFVLGESGQDGIWIASGDFTQTLPESVWELEETQMHITIDDAYFPILLSMFYPSNEVIL